MSAIVGTAIRLTTSEAAGLIGAHESSVRRWCNAGALACSHTAGGHRRIALDTLLAFARAEDLPCPLLALAPWEAEVWQALARAQGEEDYADLATLTYQWLREGKTPLSSRLLRLGIERGLPLSALFDRAVTSAMHRAGADWYEGRLDVGDVHLMTQAAFDALYALRFHVQDQRFEKDGKTESSRRRAGPVALVGCAEKGRHELGALMTRTVLDAAGWRVAYLGADVPTEEFARQQAKHRAELVCVSVVPPQAPSDARRLVRALAHHYDAGRPYRLILGGRTLQEAPVPGGEDTPFLGCRVLPNMEALARWMRTRPRSN